MTETFEAAVDLTRHFSIPVERTVEHVAWRPARLGQTEIFHDDEFGD